jgi:hypothetical protein
VSFILSTGLAEGLAFQVEDESERVLDGLDALNNELSDCDG